MGTEGATVRRGATALLTALLKEIITFAGVIKIMITIPLSSENLRQLIFRPRRRSLETMPVKMIKRLKKFEKNANIFKIADIKILKNIQLNL